VAGEDAARQRVVVDAFRLGPQRHDQETAFDQRAPRADEGGDRVVEVHERPARQHGVEARRRQGVELLRVADAELDRSDALGGRPFARHRDHPRVALDPEDVAERPDATCRGQRRLAAAAREVEDSVSRKEPRQRHHPRAHRRSQPRLDGVIGAPDRLDLGRARRRQRQDFVFATWRRWIVPSSISA